MPGRNHCFVYFFLVRPRRRDNMLFSICCMVNVTGSQSIRARAWQRGQRSRPHPFLPMKPLLIKAKDNYFLDLFCSMPRLLLLPTFSFLYLLPLFLFTAPSFLHHMVADQIMSNILPLQVFAICSFQT